MAQLFDHVVIDESSQLDVGKSLFPLCLLSGHGELALFSAITYRCRRSSRHSPREGPNGWSAAFKITC